MRSGLTVWDKLKPNNCCMLIKKCNYYTRLLTVCNIRRNDICISLTGSNNGKIVIHFIAWEEPVVFWDNLFVKVLYVTIGHCPLFLLANTRPMSIIHYKRVRFLALYACSSLLSGGSSVIK
jgi:hypothetical protein